MEERGDGFDSIFSQRTHNGLRCDTSRLYLRGRCEYVLTGTLIYSYRLPIEGDRGRSSSADSAKNPRRSDDTQWAIQRMCCASSKRDTFLLASKSFFRKTLADALPTPRVAISLGHYSSFRFIVGIPFRGKCWCNDRFTALRYIAFTALYRVL